MWYKCKDLTKIKQLSRLEDPLIVFQISIIQNLFITQLETTYKESSNKLLAWLY